MIERTKEQIQNQNDLQRTQQLLGIDSMICCLSDEGIRQCAVYLSYRIQRALFDVFRACDGTMTWEEFVERICAQQIIRDAAKTAAVTAVKYAAFDGFGTVLREDVDLGRDLHDEQIQMAKWRDDETEEALILLLMLRAQMAHHRMLSAARGEQYTLRCYMEELKTSGELREELAGGLLLALKRLDFRGVWLGGGVHHLLDLYGIRQEKGGVQRLTIEDLLDS